ncbi:MAG: histidine phosphatase family protein [Selenomonadaceae bacterium]|nr:histidine phosphatase family protein [Selenomonadaceae bacterium]
MRLLKIFFAVVLSWLFIFIPAQVSAESTTVILVRHGETFYNAQKRPQGFLDIKLNENGLQQAKLLANSLKDYPIDVFIASPLNRAYVTTETVAKMHGKTIAYTDDRLKEINFGDWAGLTPEEQISKFPTVTKLWNETPWLVTFPNGENLRDLQYRGRAALEEAVAKYPGKTIFIGAHSFTNMAILCSVLGIDLEHFRQLSQNNTCVNVLKYEDGVWTLVTMNSVAHLGKLNM